MAWGGPLRVRAATALTGLITVILITLAAPAGACTRVGGVSFGDCRQPPTSTSQDTASTSPETLALRMINKERRQLGLRTLRPDARARAVAEEHARRMARRGRIYHNPALGTAAGRRRLGSPAFVGENVGVGPSVRAVHTAFMRSDDHRRNILLPRYRRVGVGAAWQNGSLWVVEVFLTRPAAAVDHPVASVHPPAGRASTSPGAGVAPSLTVQGMRVGAPTGPTHAGTYPLGAAFHAASSSGGTGVAGALVGLGSLSLGLFLRRRPQTARRSA